MGEPRWLTPEEAAVWKKYRTLRRELQLAQDRQLARDSGLSGADYALLAPLSESPEGVLRFRELGLEVGWERSRLSHQLTRMEKRGLVTREACPGDARGAMIRLTRHGRDAIEAAAPQHVEAVQRLFFDPLTPGEMRVFEGFLDRMLAALERESAAHRPNGSAGKLARPGLRPG
ncbi:DNA-binding MarR family transcriptional regulator [Streptosporangium album]|uniref:DNA-binding MarR family transcriptional regulator n=1 Tax=Streptosporangium album TaxID=47479 RepID=A0A7W7S4A3_9ACTN|nr:MarR family transcriptional regulator [Streptosporangium album]MBB4942671.1 DNA-binding MarR family transcriptional regulator [Streptosporangium album]